MSKEESPPVDLGGRTAVEPESPIPRRAADLRKFGAHTVPPGVRAGIAAIELPSMPQDRFKDTLPPSEALEIREVVPISGTLAQPLGTQTMSGLGPPTGQVDPTIALPRVRPLRRTTVMAVVGAFVALLGMGIGIAVGIGAMNRKEPAVGTSGTRHLQLSPSSTAAAAAPARSSSQQTAEGDTATPLPLPQVEGSDASRTFIPKTKSATTSANRRTREPRTKNRKRPAFYDDDDSNESVHSP
jgi:hypothetical protein